MCTICFLFAGELPRSSGLQASRTNVSAIPQRHSTQLALLQEGNYSSLNYTTPPKPWAALKSPKAKGLDWTTLGPCDSDRNFPRLPVISVGLYVVILPQHTLCTAETSSNTFICTWAGVVFPMEPLYSSGPFTLAKKKTEQKAKIWPFLVWWATRKSSFCFPYLTKVK